VAGLAAVGLMGLELVGLQMMGSGESPAMLMSAIYDSEPIQVDVLESPSHPYRMASPGAGWERRSDESAHADNPVTDVWLVEPTRDAHIMVIAEAADPGYAFEVDALVEAVVENAQTEYATFEVTSERHLAGVSTLGKQIDADALVDGTKMHFRYGVFANGRHGIQVVCFARDKSFTSVEADCDDVLGSFQFDDSRLLALY
jgi:hypothetical protein